MASLEERAREKISEVTETIALYNAGSHAAWHGLMLTDIGREKMEGVRRVADVLTVTEERRLGIERAAIYRTLGAGRIGVYGLTLLSLLAYLSGRINSITLLVSGLMLVAAAVVLLALR